VVEYPENTKRSHFCLVSAYNVVNNYSQFLAVEFGLICITVGVLMFF